MSDYIRKISLPSAENKETGVLPLNIVSMIINTPVSIHYHNFFEVELFISGRIINVVGGRKYQVKAPAIVLSNQHEYQEIQVLEPAEIIKMQFDPFYYPQLSGIGVTAPRLLEPFLDQKTLYRYNQPLSAEIFRDFFAIASLLLKEYDVAQPASRFALTSLFNYYLILIYRNYRSASADKNVSGNYNAGHYHVFFQILQYINSESNQEAVKIMDLSRHLGMSHTHLTAVFKQFTGKPLKTFLLEKKISIACSLLRESLQPVSSICHLCGFNDLSSFNRIFRKITGSSPRMYRAQCK